MWTAQAEIVENLKCCVYSLGFLLNKGKPPEGLEQCGLIYLF